MQSEARLKNSALIDAVRRPSTMRAPALIAALAGALALVKLIASKGVDAGISTPKRRRSTTPKKKPSDVDVSTVIRTDVLPFDVVKSKREIDFEEKNLIDGWLFANRDEVNMFGDARGTKYEFGTPLKATDGSGRANDKYEYVAARNPKRPWIARFPKHWGKQPEVETRDYVQLPEKYGYGSSTLKAWIEEKMAKDAQTTRAETEAAQSPMSGVKAAASPAISAVSEKTVAKFRAAAVAAAPSTPGGDAGEEAGDEATSRATAA